MCLDQGLVDREGLQKHLPQNQGLCMVSLVHFPLKHTTWQFHSKTRDTAIWGACYAFFYEQEIHDRQETRQWLLSELSEQALTSLSSLRSQTGCLWAWPGWYLFYLTYNGFENLLVTTLKQERLQAMIQILPSLGKQTSDNMELARLYLTHQLVFEFIIPQFRP